MSSEIHCECAVAGVCGFEKAAFSVRDMLQLQQHRGEDASGVASSNDKKEILVVKGIGPVDFVLTDEAIKELHGQIAIGHDRYPTTGRRDKANTQPHLTFDPNLALCANGDLLPFCYEAERKKLLVHQIGFDSQNDGELLAKFIAFRLQQGYSLSETITELMQTMVGCYSALLLINGGMVAFRDPLGMRPLVIGRRKNTWLAASETCAFGVVEGDYAREVRPGEMVIFTPGRDPESFQLMPPRPKYCIFEWIYFSRPDSIVFGIPTYFFRERLGALLWQQLLEMLESIRPQAQFVIPIPDSGNVAAEGFSRASGLPYRMALVRSHRIGRQFIRQLPQRQESIRMKFNPVIALIAGAEFFALDDSIVRGNATEKITKMLLRNGAKAIHWLISSPPIRHSCFYGIDTKTLGELIAAQKTTEEIRQHIGAASITYLRMDNLRQAVREVGADPENFCYACFDGNYPTPIAT